MRLSKWSLSYSTSPGLACACYLKAPYAAILRFGKEAWKTGDGS